jgi:hypothetical protein
VVEINGGSKCSVLFFPEMNGGLIYA